MIVDLKEVTKGYVVSSKPKLIDLARQIAFTGPTPNWHNNYEEAKKLGFDAPVTIGGQLIAILSPMLRDFFGETWFTTGKMSVTFIKPSYTDETVTAKGQVSDIQQEESGTRIFLDLWCENQLGAKLLVGQASAILR